MPDRIVRVGILSSDAINALSWGAEVFYRRLMSMADDYGRYDGRTTVLRAVLYPLKLDRVSEADVDKWKAECAKAGLVSRYTVDSKEYVGIERFRQRIQGKPKWPPPDSTVIHGESPLYSETGTETKVNIKARPTSGEWAERIRDAYVSTTHQAGAIQCILASMLKGHAPEVILQGTRECAAAIRSKEQAIGGRYGFTPNPEKFFEQELWNDSGLFISRLETRRGRQENETSERPTMQL